MLLESIEELKSTNGKLKFYIAGDGKEEEIKNLKLLIMEKKLTEQVIFFGRADEKNKLELYKNAQAVIIPSRFETFSNVALETLGSGKQLICFDIPGLSWIPNDLAIKAPKISSKKLTHSILKFLDENKNYSLIADNSRSFAKNFTWDRAAEGYYKVFKKVSKK